MVHFIIQYYITLYYNNVRGSGDELLGPSDRLRLGSEADARKARRLWPADKKVDSNSSHHDYDHTAS